MHVLPARGRAVHVSVAFLRHARLHPSKHLLFNKTSAFFSHSFVDIGNYCFTLHHSV